MATVAAATVGDGLSLVLWWARSAHLSSDDSDCYDNMVITMDLPIIAHQLTLLFINEISYKCTIIMDNRFYNIE